MSQQHSTSKRPRTLTQLAGRVFTVAITVVLALVAAVLVPVGAATAANAPVLDLEKTASKTTIEPGQEFSYTLKLTCSGLQEGCVDATITDTLPAEFDVTSIPASSNERDVTYDANTRLLTIKFKIPLSSPAGSTGLPAGSKAVQVGMRLPTETPVLQGQEISNTANATDTNGSPPQDATVKITANIPVAVRPVATKSWSPSSSIAQSGNCASADLCRSMAALTRATSRWLCSPDPSRCHAMVRSIAASRRGKARKWSLPGGTASIVDAGVMHIPAPVIVKSSCSSGVSTSSRIDGSNPCRRSCSSIGFTPPALSLRLSQTSG